MLARDSRRRHLQLVGKQPVRPVRQVPAPKALAQIPVRFAIEMSDRGWILRNEIIWHKPNTMPQSVKDRFSVDYERFFFFTKSRHYYFDQQFEPLSQETLTDNRTIGEAWTEKRPGRDFVGQASRGGGY